MAEHHTRPEEIIAIDPNRVLMISVEEFKGRDGIEVTAPFASIFTIRDGKIIRWQAYWNKESAFKAVGPM